MINLDEVWPVGRLADIQIRIKESGGGDCLISALNDRIENFDVFFKKIEIVRVGFDSSMDGGGKNIDCELKLLIDEINSYEAGDYLAISRVKQRLISMLNSSVSRS